MHFRLRGQWVNYSCKKSFNIENQNPVPDPEVSRVLPDDGQGLFSLDLICNRNKLERFSKKSFLILEQVMGFNLPRYQPTNRKMLV
jgi:hypothetical protein